MRAAAGAVLAVIVAASGCSRDLPPDSADDGPKCFVSRCYEEAGSTCGAGKLPRVVPGAWSDAEVRALVERSRAGTVAVAVAAERTGLVAECTLDGVYTEVNGKHGGGRLWATNRLLVLPSEVGEGCDSATHLVAAFVTRGSAFSAVLVPLPCPSIAETVPAQRCLGQGATGAERRDRAGTAIRAMPSETRYQQDPEWVLETYSLAPDYWLGLQLLGRIDSECAVYEQARWVGSRYSVRHDASGERTAALIPEEKPPPRIDEERSWYDCSYQPAFLKCFPGLFEPSPGPSGCWEPAKTGAQPL